MAAQRDASFDRRLEQLLVQRLQAGQAPEALLDELRARLDPAEADALMSRAEARAADAKAPVDRTVRVLAGLAYAWTVLLVVQNIFVVTTVVGGLESVSPDERQGLLIPHMAFALAKIGLLCSGVLVFKRWRSLPTTGFYVAAILFAFPLGLYVQDWMLGTAKWGVDRMMTVSAICSYAAALCAAVVFMRAREAARPAITVEAFD